MLSATLLIDAVDVGLAAARAYTIQIVLVCIALRVVYLLWLHPLADIPGPQLAALTDLWKTQAAIRGCFSSSLHEYHATYGDIVRIGPNEVSIISPNDVKAVYGHNTRFTKGPFYDAWSIIGKSQFSDRNEATHAVLRRAVSVAYSLKYITSLERYCDSCTNLLFRHLDKASESGTVVDLSKFMEWYTYDCVSGIAFGKYFGLLEDGGDKTGVLSVLAQATETTTAAATLSNFGWILPARPVSWLLSVALGDKGPNFFLGYASRIVKERQERRDIHRTAYEAEEDMLYRFMESTDPETSQPLNNRLLINNSITILVAGADTTKISVVAFLRYVYAHPPTVKRLRKEMDDAIAAGELSFPITFAQASRLQFAWACIKESMRLHPVVGMTLQRVVPPGGRVIGGRFYRAGTLVGMSPRELHHDIRAYGKDAGEWRPERWLEDHRSELEKFSLVVGIFNVIASGLWKNISLMEMSKLLPTIIHHYDIVIKDSEKPWKVHESWFESQHEFFCTITKRVHLA